jgi:hypothetical protein
MRPWFLLKRSTAVQINPWPQKGTEGAKNGEGPTIEFPDFCDFFVPSCGEKNGHRISEFAQDCLIQAEACGYRSNIPRIPVTPR